MKYIVEKETGYGWVIVGEYSSFEKARQEKAKLAASSQETGETARYRIVSLNK